MPKEKFTDMLKRVAQKHPAHAQAMAAYSKRSGVPVKNLKMESKKK